jgi:hypothetical protein
MNNGDIFKLPHQSINGINTFLWFNNKWYYFEERLSKEYEYDQRDLTSMVIDINGFEEPQHLGNIFQLIKN